MAHAYNRRDFIKLLAAGAALEPTIPAWASFDWPTEPAVKET